MTGSKLCARGLVLILIFGFMNTGILSGQMMTDQILWKAGNGNYKNYRIPSLLLTSKGTLLAFCEGREGGDSGDIDILLKRSENGGRSWSKELVVWNDDSNTCGNPCAVEDVETGRIWLLMTWNNGRDTEAGIIARESTDSRVPYVSYSDNDGITWAAPVKMPSSCKDPDWGWYATGPGIGIQLRNNRFNGRLIIPANHSYNDPAGKINNKSFNYGSHVLISDDHGKTWHMSRPIIPGCNESQVVELGNGDLMMNMRSYNNRYCRAISVSHDGGESWSEIQHDPQLVESKCQASFLRYGPYKGETMYLFANPAVPFGRTHMTIRASVDECTGWSNSKLIFAGPSAYSCMVKISDRYTGLFFECGDKDPYETLRFIGFPTQELFQPGTLIPGSGPLLNNK